MRSFGPTSASVMEQARTLQAGDPLPVLFGGPSPLPGQDGKKSKPRGAA